MLKAAIPAPLPTIPRAILFLLTLETQQPMACSLLFAATCRGVRNTWQHNTYLSRPLWERILQHYAHNGSQSSKQSKRFRKKGKSRSLAFRQKVVESWEPSGIWGRTDKAPVSGRVSLHLHCCFGKTLLQWPTVTEGDATLGVHLLSQKQRCQNPDLFPQLHFTWNYSFITHNKAHSSLSSHGAAHTGIPSFMQVLELMASRQEYAILLNLLWHLHQYNRITQTVVWPASMDTMWIMVF